MCPFLVLSWLRNGKLVKIFESLINFRISGVEALVYSITFSGGIITQSVS